MTGQQARFVEALGPARNQFQCEALFVIDHSERPHHVAGRVAPSWLQLIAAYALNAACAWMIVFIDPNSACLA